MDSLLQYESDLSQRLSHPLCYPDPNNNDGCDTNTTVTSLKEDKYSLRPRSLRHQENDKNPTEPNKMRKPKQKPPPLSKYRRKTANARERCRMKEINQAFETLRKAVPFPISVGPISSANEKLTKITTLRLAMQYISSLSATLNSCEGDFNRDLDLFTDYSDLEFLLESDGESLPLSDHSLLASSPDFPEASLSPVDFDDPSLLQTDFGDHELDASDFSDFLLT